LIPGNCKLAQLLTKMKKESGLRDDRALYFFAKNVVVKHDMSFGELEGKYKDEDGVLYLRVTDIPTFGSALINK